MVYYKDYHLSQPQNTSTIMGFVKVLAVLLALFSIFCLFWLAMVRNLNPTTIKQSDGASFHDNFMQINEARLSEKWNEEAGLDIADEGKFHIVTNIILVTHKHYHANLLYDQAREPIYKELELRQKEIETSLQKNLNNDLIAAVHVLYFHPAVQSYLMKLQLTDSQKLVLHLTRRDPTVAINLDYIQKYLQNKFVILMHQDNFLGEGWNLIDFEKLRRKRLMYALTRHSVTEQYPCNAAVGAKCNPGSIYLGSHDTFVFHVDKDFPSEMLKDLDIVPSSSGMENVLIWYFEKKLKYRVLNPCRKIIVYHNHCINLREKNRQRYNKRGKNGMASFTNDLE